MKIFFAFNLAALPLTLLLTMVSLAKLEGERAWYSCEVALLGSFIYVCVGFLVSLVGLFILMANNHDQPADEQFVDPVTLQLIPDAQLGTKAAAGKRWLKFIMVSVPLSLLLMPALGILRSFLEINGLCVLGR